MMRCLIHAAAGASIGDVIAAGAATFPQIQGWLRDGFLVSDPPLRGSNLV